MATFRYFATVGGETVQLTKVQHDGDVYTSAKHFTGIAPTGERVQCDRAIQMKNNPKNHKCGSRCTNATGFLCECACGGKNHARGDA